MIRALAVVAVVALTASLAAAQPGTEPVQDSDGKTNPGTEEPQPGAEDVRDSDEKTNPGTVEGDKTNPGTVQEGGVAPELPPERPKTPFDRGRVGLSAGAGSTTAFGEQYFAIGAGASYFVLDGVAIDFGTQVQWGDGPTILRTTPGLRYVAQPLVGHSPLIPYIAGYYTHWFIGDAVPDADALGTRGGLLYVSGSIVLGLGIGYEHLVSECTMNCSSVYPDLTISVAL